MESKKKMLEIIEKKCKDKDNDIYFNILKEIFSRTSNYLGGPSEFRKRDIKKIIDRNIEEIS